MDINIICEICDCVMDDDRDRTGNIIARCDTCVKQYETDVDELQVEIQERDERIEQLERFINDYISDEKVVDNPEQTVKMIRIKEGETI